MGYSVRGSGASKNILESVKVNDAEGELYSLLEFAARSCPVGQDFAELRYFPSVRDVRFDLNFIPFGFSKVFQTQKVSD